MHTAAAGEVRQPEDRREQILEAATAVFLDRGIDGARLREVSQRAGVSIGLIQHYFGSREDLFSQVARHASERLLTKFTIDEHEIADPWERIHALIDRWASIEDLVSHSAVWLHFADAARQSGTRNGIFASIYWRWYTYATNAVRDGIDAGTMNPVMSVDDAVSVFMAFFDGYEVELATGIVEPDAEEIRRRARALSVALFVPADGAAP